MATEGTRAALLEAATRVFAEQGVRNGSLVEITRRAGARNRGSVHYHFGGRDGLLVAVLDQVTPFLARREGELLARAEEAPGSPLDAYVEAVVRPAVELAQSGWQGQCVLAILGELVDQDPASQSAEVAEALVRTGGYAVYEALGARMPAMSEELRNERFALVTAFFLGVVARRARTAMAAAGSRPQLPDDRFVANLTAMCSAMLSAPVLP